MAVSKGGVKMPRISTGRKSVLMTADPYHTPGFVVCLSSSRIRSDYFKSVKSLNILRASL